MNLSTLSLCIIGLVPLIVHSLPQYRQRLGQTQEASRYNSRGQGRRSGGRGRGGYGRRRPPPVVEYDDGTEYDDGYESIEDRRYQGGRGRYGGGRNRETYRERLPPPSATERPRRPSTTTTPQPENERSTEDDGGCGPECRNLLHEVDHPKEEERCPYEGMVLDIYGYCRQQHQRHKSCG